MRSKVHLLIRDEDIADLGSISCEMPQSATNDCTRLELPFLVRGFVLSNAIEVV